MSENEELPQPSSEPPSSDAGSSTGLDTKVASTLCYSLGWISGIVFYLLEKQSSEVRFHAVQSIVSFGPLHLLVFLIGAVIPPLSLVVWLGAGALWLMSLFKAYQGEHFELPVAGQIAAQNSALPSGRE